jgi:hypothetical protein
MFFFFRSPLNVAGFFQRQKLFVSDFCLCSSFFVSVAIAQSIPILNVFIKLCRLCTFQFQAPRIEDEDLLTRYGPMFPN